MRLFIRVQACRRCFDPFPNPHIRVTAFLISRTLFLDTWPKLVWSKRGAYLVECGKHSCTRRVEARNLKALVVGRDGIGYAPADWWKSGTFRRDAQANLLVSDNRTHQYAAADANAKARLAAAAWGPQAASELPANPPVGVVIVNHNLNAELRETLESFRKVNYPGLKVVVSDNASTDGSQEMVRQEFPEVHLLAHEQEQGYARAASLGFAFLVDQTKYIFSTTNDVLVDPEILNVLVDHAERHPEAGVLGTKIFFRDRPRVIWHAGGVVSAWHGHSRHIGWGRLDHPRYDDVTECDFVTGCGFLLRSEALKRTGYFNEDLVFYCEDSDLCFRIRQQGYKIVFVPQAKMWHKVSTTSHQNRALQLHYSTRNELYLLQHHRVGLFPFTLLAHVLGACLAKMLFFAALFRWSNCRGIYRGIRDWQRHRYGWIPG